MSVDLQSKNSLLRESVIDHARSLIGQVSYVFEFENCEPPSKMNCYVFLYWIFDSCGISLPIRFNHQINAGRLLDVDEPRQSGDIVLATAKWGGMAREKSSLTNIGHVALVTGENTLIHNQLDEGIIEQSASPFLTDPKFYLGAIRVIE